MGSYDPGVFLNSLSDLSSVIILTMLSQNLVFLIFTSYLVSLSSASDPSLDDDDDEGRQIFTSGGTAFIALNQTFALLAAALLGASLLGLLFLLGTNPGAGADQGGYGGGGSGYGSGYGGGSGYGSHKTRREANWDFTEQLNRLAEAFHKYEIDEAQGCQLYVACESSNVAQHYKNGPLAKTVYTVMRTIAAPENSHLYEDDKYLQDILQAFKAGERGESCDYFRKQCRKDKIFG